VLEDLIRAWDGEEVVAHFDEPSGAWMFICLHSTRRGPAGGGTRLQVYPSAADALEDAMRLAEGMTLKMSAADLPFGGGKPVLSVPTLPTGEERRRLLLRYADLVASLGGTLTVIYERAETEGITTAAAAEQIALARARGRRPSNE
jgi:leucine dehydrogenase